LDARDQREQQIKVLRKRYNQIKRASKSGNIFHVWDAAGVIVPRIDHRPVLEEYGISQEDVDRIPIEKLAWRERLDKREGIITAICILVGLISGPYSAYQVLKGDGTEWFSIGIMLSFVFLSGIVGCLFGGTLWGLLSAILVGLLGGKPPKSEIEKKYERYTTDLQHYEYWEWKNKKAYWFSLTGDQFEHALAALYRNLSYQAEVTKAGGDKGIDIIVDDGRQPFIVQCKAHKNKIGPSAIRDFYGTMVHNGYSKGVFASLSGFTAGAVEFAEGKNMLLIDVDDIMLNKII
jgi:hypothetical protein